MGLPGLWSPITLRADLRLQCSLKKSCRSRRDLSNGMSHVLYNQVFRVDSRLLVVGSQNWQTPGNSIPDPSFGHNLCYKYLNEQCEPILDIYVSRAFSWYKERPNPLRFGPCNRSLKFRESTGTPLPKVGVALGVWRFTPSYSLTLSNTPGSMWCDSRASSCLNSRASSWPALLQCFCLDSRASFLLACNLATPLALVASPKLGLRQVVWPWALPHSHHLGVVQPKLWAQLVTCPSPFEMGWLPLPNVPNCYNKTRPTPNGPPNLVDSPPHNSLGIVGSPSSPS
jgi:hypothetical protein